MTGALSSSYNWSDKLAEDLSEAQAEAESEKAPLIDLHNLGVWYQLRTPKNLPLSPGSSFRRPREKQCFWALRHISLRCYEGQVLGVIGQNGAGKSTLCLTLAQILTPDEGEIRVRGQVTPLFGLGTGFNRELTGRENIYIYAAFLGIPRKEIQRKMDEIIDFSELGHFIDEPLYTYSTGMRGRLGFSVAAILEPEILILDEVLGAGDRAFRNKSRNRILEMMRNSKLIVIVLHANNFLRKVCTHCLWLEKGSVRRFGKAPEVLDEYDRALGGADPVDLSE